MAFLQPLVLDAELPEDEETQKPREHGREEFQFQIRGRHTRQPEPVEPEVGQVEEQGGPSQRHGQSKHAFICPESPLKADA